MPEKHFPWSLHIQNNFLTHNLTWRVVRVLKAIFKYNKISLSKLVMSDGNSPVKIDGGRG